MMNIDSARTGEGVVSPKKEDEKESGGVTSSPVFSGVEQDMKIEVPTGWSVKDS